VCVATHSHLKRAENASKKIREGCQAEKVAVRLLVEQDDVPYKVYGRKSVSMGYLVFLFRLLFVLRKESSMK